MRGEHFMTASRKPSLVGSSPHARGARDEDRRHRLHRGIIPACAGSTVCLSRHHGCARDHPRMRGEHSTLRIPTPWDAGSSPHARGALTSDIVNGIIDGIIPACAGSTGRSRTGPCRRRDHPRMRGEHGSTTWGLHTSPGSSPHARGARLWRWRHWRVYGIIPACAGSTL